MNNNPYAHFDRLFSKKTDPWAFSRSPYEKTRFEKMLKLTKSVAHANILEIGCAEGHFTKYLLTISKNVTAIDVSKDALARAQKRAPGAKFIHSSIDNYKLPTQKFDLIVASEVMYYVKDKKAVFAKIKKAGKYLLMSNWMIYDYVLARYLKDIKLVKTMHQARLHELLKYCRISLWKLNND